MTLPAETVPLAKAAFIRGRFVREVEMRVPSQEEVDAAWAEYDDAGARGLALGAFACGLPVSAVRKMSAENQAILVARLEAMLA